MRGTEAKYERALPLGMGESDFGGKFAGGWGFFFVRPGGQIALVFVFPCVTQCFLALIPATAPMVPMLFFVVKTFHAH